MAEPKFFEYTTRLADDEIRVLSFIPPTSPNSHEPLSFRLQTTTLPRHEPLSPSQTFLHNPTPTPFIALSYVWGPQTNPVPILIDEHRFLVTPNLHSALTHLASNELLARPLWADAVCINQSDAVEKHAQIRRMAEIYRRAERVVVFLGEGDRKTDRAVAQMERIGSRVMAAGVFRFSSLDFARWPTFEGCEDRERKIEARERLDKIIAEERGRLFFKKPGLDVGVAIEVFERPWFSRVWVVQELCVPRQGDGVVMFAVGSARICWDRLLAIQIFLSLWIAKEFQVFDNATVVGFLLRAPLFHWRMRTVFPNGPGWSQRAKRMLGMRHRRFNSSVRVVRSLRDVVMELYVGDAGDPLVCRDPVDRIWAIRGLLDASEDVEFLDEIMTPDATWEQVFTRLACHFYGQGHLDFLGLCRCRSPALPSWVIDWTQDQRPLWLGYNTRDESQLFDAGKGSNTQIYAHESNDRTLCLAGFLVDTIQEVGSEWTSRPGDGPAEFNWDSATLRVTELDRFISLSDRYSPAEKRDARWRIIVADRMPNNMMQLVRATSSRAAEECFAMLEANDVSAVMGTEPGRLGIYQSFLMKLWSSRPFLSSTGYVGLCPGTARAGDTLFIPSGSHCPYVIRRAEASITSPGGSVLPAQADLSTTEEWQLLGEAYVHGIMDGELDLGNKKPEARRFWLI